MAATERRWYSTEGTFEWDRKPIEPRASIHQSDRRIHSLPERIVRLAYVEYRAQGNDQPFDTLQSRGGFSLAELVLLLADHVERLGGSAHVPVRPEPTRRDPE